MKWSDFLCFSWRYINPSSVRSEFHLSRVYCKTYALYLNNRLEKDAIALRSLILAMRDLYPNNNFIFIQDSAPFHRAKIVQNFLQEELKSRFAANTECPPSSFDWNPLDYYFWNEVKEKIYSGHSAKPFESEKELKTGFSLCGTNVL